MRKLLCASIFGLVTMTAPPWAYADDDSYVAAARALGMQQSAEYIINGGRNVCVMMGFGQNWDQLSDRVMGNTRLDASQAHQLIALSVHEYCPQFNDRVSG